MSPEKLILLRPVPTRKGGKKRTFYSKSDVQSSATSGWVEKKKIHICVILQCYTIFSYTCTMFAFSSVRHWRVSGRDLGLWTILHQHCGSVRVLLSTGLPFEWGPALLRVWVTFSAFQIPLCISSWHITLYLVSLALYGRELEEEDEEEEDEEVQLEAGRLPDLLFRNAPQLLQYTAALRSHYGSEDDDDDDGSHRGDSEKVLEILRERRGELRLESHIGTVKKQNPKTRKTKHVCWVCTLCLTRSILFYYSPFVFLLNVDDLQEFPLEFPFLVCLDDSFGEDCSVSCEDCVHGACNENRDRCECLPGWTGVICNESEDL